VRSAWRLPPPDLPSVANVYINHWYFAPLPISTSGAPALRQTTSSALPVGVGAIAAVSLLFPVKWAVDTKIRGQQQGGLRALVEEPARVPPDERIHQIDASG
jgi:hypothetical protein